MKGPILLVDDDIDVRSSLEGYLTDNDYFVLTYASGREAISAINNSLIYRIAFIDLSLRDVGGDEVMEISKRNNPHIPVYCMSGYKFAPEYVNGYISKTGPVSDIIKILESHLK